MDRLSFYENIDAKEIIVMNSSSIQKFIYIHNKNEVILKTQLVTNEEVEQYQIKYKDYLIRDITNEHFLEDFKNIKKLNLELFHEVKLDELKANYLKDPNIDASNKQK
ncbi:hypothetical protein IKS57_05205 [bacterium]|nr:hypothetical protein [bacterium]